MHIDLTPDQRALQAEINGYMAGLMTPELEEELHHQTAHAVADQHHLPVPEPVDGLPVDADHLLEGEVPQGWIRVGAESGGAALPTGPGGRQGLVATGLEGLPPRVPALGGHEHPVHEDRDRGLLGGGEDQRGEEEPHERGVAWG